MFISSVLLLRLNQGHFNPVHEIHCIDCLNCTGKQKCIDKPMDAAFANRIPFVLSTQECVPDLCGSKGNPQEKPPRWGPLKKTQTHKCSNAAVTHT